nr:Dihydrofolate reductase [uncultured bacterium]
MAQESKVSLIAAIATSNRAIGKDGKLLWNLKEDMERFKTLTAGHPVIMGRKTWESIPEKYRPLPGRTNIVITRTRDYAAPGAVLAQTFPEALSLAKDAEGNDEIFAIGGQRVYECALPFASRMYLTLVERDFEGDAFFPSYPDFTKEVACEKKSEGDMHYTFVTLERTES